MILQRASSFQLLVFVVAVLAPGCTQVDPRRGESEVLRELGAAHPWLVPEGADVASYYQPWRRVWCENSNVEMALFNPPDSLDQGHRIVLFRNVGSDKPVGLVLPSNASTDYWKFEFDSMVGPLRDTSDFSSELLRVARSLGMASHPNEYRGLVFDLFRGLLLTDMVQARDSAILWTFTSTEGLGNEGDSLSRARHDRIMEALADTTYGVGVPPRPVAFFDDDASRIYLFEPMDLYGGEPPWGIVHVYRWGQNVIPLEL